MASPPSQFSQAAEAFQRGHYQQAAELFNQLLDEEPDNAELYHLLGLTYSRMGQPGPAVHNVEHAIKLLPHNPLYHNNLGEIWRLQQQLPQAISCYQQAIQLNPEFSEAHFNLANCLRLAGQLEAAAGHYQQTITLQPGRGEAHFQLGNIYQTQGKLDEAANCYHQALKLAPNHAGAHHELGVLHLTVTRYEEAADHFQQAVRLNPNSINSYANLGMALEQLGKTDEAMQAFQPVLEQEPDNVPLHIHVAALCPLMPQGNEQIDAYRAAVSQTLAEYAAQPSRPITLDALQTANVYPPYSWHYHGRPQRRLREAWADVFRPRLPRTMLAHTTETSDKPHLGFVVTAGHEGIFVKTLMGLINQLPDESFTVTVVANPLGEVRLKKAISSPHVRLMICPPHLEPMITAMRDARFDLLCFSEVGSDSLNYFLPFFRLAPVQCLTGSTMGCTSGVAEVDYYLSSVWLETEESDTHYSEQLVRLQQMDPDYRRPDVPGTLQPRSHFGFTKDQHLYVCAQNLLKIHPDFDRLAANILQGDPNGLLVFIRNKASLAEQLHCRLAQTMPDEMGRVRFVPYLSNPVDYFSFLAIADVALDTPHFGGANMTYDTFAVGSPLVTLPNQFMRSRRTEAIYHRMEVAGPVATSDETYVDLAVEIATNPDRRAGLSEKIRKGFDTLFTAQNAAQEMADFFAQVTGQR